MSVSRETARLAERFGLGPDAAERFERLLRGLEGDPHAPTPIREPSRAIDAHLADSLVALELPELSGAGRIADVGAGAGFPGLALAAALPGARVDLVESGRRKCESIEALAEAAGLAGARAITARAEDWGGSEGREAYEVVTARAVGPLAVLAEYGAPLLRDGGVLVAWKGVRDGDEERSGAAAAARVGLSDARVVRVEPFPGARNRHLHVFRKLGPTPTGFPRRPGMAAKRPLG